jgi:hypothetical protein
MDKENIVIKTNSSGSEGSPFKGGKGDVFKN